MKGTILVSLTPSALLNKLRKNEICGCCLVLLGQHVHVCVFFIGEFFIYLGLSGWMRLNWRDYAL